MWPVASVIYSVLKRNTLVYMSYVHRELLLTLVYSTAGCEVKCEESVWIKYLKDLFTSHLLNAITTYIVAVNLVVVDVRYDDIFCRYSQTMRAGERFSTSRSTVSTWPMAAPGLVPYEIWT